MDFKADFENAIRRLAHDVPHMTLESAIAYMDDLPAQRLPQSQEGLALYALENNPLILGMIRDEKKIIAIKELREASGVGLKEAKEVIELAQHMLDDGYTPEAERLEADRLASDAIDSIKQSFQSVQHIKKAALDHGIALR